VVQSTIKTLIDLCTRRPWWVIAISALLAVGASVHAARHFAINTDITKRKKIEQQFLRAQRMESIGTLASGIAHDLNNVIAPLMMSVEFLKLQIPESEDQEMLLTLERCCQRASDLVRQVLSFARGVEGQRIPINPLHLMRELTQVLRDTLPKSIEVHFKPAKDLWMVTGDSTQLHQVFLNLCVNARDAMPNGGILNIELENMVLDETYAAMNPDSTHGAKMAAKPLTLCLLDGVFAVCRVR